ncbi:MAG: hypothetical protein COT59_01130 [Candidatus Nealsonbacteria bacterium CG09_land_8_20_14_0_10_42_14]|uniref:Uncharacterized protein n=1 Tax=Candidatus Nealsonbacteria bacterium CG09_land_8_20_14_0_10_42_14 TaxID=1974707 RepID=A0A2H0WXL8_9BACT|nr:MAG: hypothetical protein COT59_01130 [Candidatus Nealsonbacteria bacterium CG09_land_8_20_14_0_10_42_14]
MGEIHITPKGEEWVKKILQEHNVPLEILNELGEQIRELLKEYRADPLGTIIKARSEAEFGPAKEVAERLLKELGLK